jgi:hypothetical protein
MHAFRQISRGRLLRVKAAPLHAWLPPILRPGTEEPSPDWFFNSLLGYPEPSLRG